MILCVMMISMVGCKRLRVQLWLLRLRLDGESFILALFY